MELDDAMRRLAADQHGVVSREQCRRLGASTDAMRSRVHTGDWRAVSPSVLRVAGAPVTDRSRVMAGVLDAGCRAVASHRTAAWLWGLPGFPFDRVEVTRLRGRGRRRSNLATIHEPRALTEEHCTMVDGIPVTTLARTVFDLAGVLHPARTERALDNALARSPALLPVLHRLLPELAQRGRPGISVMRALLADRPATYVAPASGLEARAIALLDAAGIATERQVDVGGTDWVGRVDLRVIGTNVVIEIDSVLHHTSHLDRARDAKRDAELRAAGHRPVHLTEHELVHEPYRAIGRVRAALLAA